MIADNQNTTIDFVEVHEHKLRAKPLIANKKNGCLIKKANMQGM